MSLTEGNGGNDMVMPVAPMYGGGGSGFGGWGGDNGWWIILLFLFALGGWGNGFGGGYGGGGAMPYIMNNTTNADVQRGFDHQAVMSGISGLQSGISGLSTQLCNTGADIQQSLCSGFAGVNATVNSGFANAETAATARQMANMNQAFGMQTAMMQGFNTLGSQFADCCCENRLGLADLKYTVATENCADRTQSMMNTRDIIDSQTRGTQAILDKLCQLELDGVKAQVDAKNDQILNLQNQLNMAAFKESQVAQNAFISQGFANEVDQLYNRLSNCPVPSTPVYGRTPIFTCNQNQGCGCGCGGNAGLI